MEKTASIDPIHPDDIELCKGLHIVTQQNPESEYAKSLLAAATMHAYLMHRGLIEDFQESFVPQLQQAVVDSL